MAPRGLLTDENSIAAVEARAEALYVQGLDCEEMGDTEGAIACYRQAAALNYPSAYCTLGDMLTLDASTRAEGLRWYHRAVRKGVDYAAWNLAMTYRMQGNRRGYFRWVRRAAQMGNGDGVKFLRVIEGIRARGMRAPMLYLDAVDDFHVRDMLSLFLKGRLQREAVHAWASRIDRGEAAIGLCQSRAVAEAVAELAEPDRRLTKARARELIFKVTPAGA